MKPSEFLKRYDGHGIYDHDCGMGGIDDCLDGNDCPYLYINPTTKLDWTFWWTMFWIDIEDTIQEGGWIHV